MKLKHNRLNIAMVLSYLFLLFLTALVVLPLYYLFVTTFKTSAEAAIAPMALPKSWNLERYITVFQKMNYPRAFFNTFVITVFSVTGIVIVTSMAGYVLNRKKTTRPAKIFFTFILVGLMFPFSLSMLGLYKIVQSLHLMNTLAAVILVNISGGIPYNTFMFKGFVGTVPFELEESARMDGAGVFKTYWKIIFPLLTPIVATMVILNSVSIWNNFMIPLYFIQSSKFRVLLLEVYSNVGQFITDWTNLFPMLVLAILPLIIFFLFMQKFIINGIMSGSLKG
jgi:raffinose/stachyose/melibiose transport system permease protein